MPNYEIVDYYYDLIGDDDFKSEENLKNSILKKDPKGTAGKWIDNSDWFKDVSPSGKVLETKTTDKNEGYIAEMQAEIDTANEETLKDIKIESDYEEESQEQLKGYIEDRKQELVEEEYEDVADEIIVQVNKATTLSEIDAIDIDIPDSEARTKAISAFNEKRFEIQEMIEKETGVFPSG